MRSILPLFRSQREVEMANLTLDVEHSCLNIDFICRQKVVKSHSIAVLEFSRLRDLNMPDRFQNKIIGAHKTFGEIVSGFHSTTRELCMEVTKTSINIKNHIDNPDEDKHTIRTSHQLLVGEFETFSIEKNQKLSYTLNEFKAIINFAEMIDSNIKVEFDEAGCPMRISTKSISKPYSAMLFCSTMASAEGHLNVSNANTNLTSCSQLSDRSAVIPAEQDFPITKAKRKRSADDETSDSRFLVGRTRSAQVDVSNNILSDAITPDILQAVIAENQICIDERSNEMQPPQHRHDNPNPTTESAEVIFETESTEGLDTVPNSPVSKIKSKLFTRCFESTFRQVGLPGADEILAPNSDDEKMDIN